MAELIGRTLAGRYEILAFLGQGGMAEVYKARHLQLDRLVAVKVMLEFLAREGSFKARFKREAHLIAQLRHPNIIQVFDYDVLEAERLYYMVVELIDGPSLADSLHELRDRGEYLRIPEVIRISHDMASALSYAHTRNMIHRDVKPSNVLMDGQRVVLTDFGLGKLLTDDGSYVTGTDTLLGTPAYMSPEQALGESGDARSDLYALGIMMYQMVTNDVPFHADTPVALLLRHVNDVVPPPHLAVPDLPPHLETVIMRLLAKLPAERYQTAKELLQDLESLNLSPAQVPPAKPRTTPIPQQLPQTTIPTRPMRRASPIVGVIGSLVILGLIAGAFLAGRTLFLTPATPSEGSTLEPPGTAAITEVATLEGTMPAISCEASVITDGIWLRTGPDSSYQLTAISLPKDTVVMVLGVFRSTSNQETWWSIRADQGSGWIAEQDIHLLNDCSAIPNITPEASSQVAPAYSPTSMDTPESNPIPGSTPLLPTEIPPSDTPPAG